MTARFNRRRFLAVGAATALSASAPAVRAAPARIVVIGGGFAGATCASYLRRLDPALAVSVVEPLARLRTCPFSNLVVAGLAPLADVTVTPAALAKRGIAVVAERAVAIDPLQRMVRLAGGGTLAYDRLVVSPGIDLRFDALPGYDRVAAGSLPHAWKAGAQTLLLRRQLEAMADGGLVIIAAPGEPYRCPPGPYERASLIAHYLAQHKPRSKILILDAKDTFSKQALFTQGWAALYPGMIEWVAGSAGGIVTSVDAPARTLYTEEGFTKHRGDVINVIPPQRAGSIAQAADLADDSGWCAVDPASFASLRQPYIHVIGDAAVAGAMPKSAFAANSQAKLCAAAIVAALQGREPPAPTWVNTCYSLVGPRYGISVSALYRIVEGAITPVKETAGVSPLDADADFRAREAAHAAAWYAAIRADTWG